MLFGLLGKPKKVAEAEDKLTEQVVKEKEELNLQLADNGIRRVVKGAIVKLGNYTIITPDIQRTSQQVQAVLDEYNIEYVILDKGRFVKCTFRNIYFELILDKNV